MENKEEFLKAFIGQLNKDNANKRAANTPYSQEFKNGMHQILTITKDGITYEFLHGMQQALELAKIAERELEKNRSINGEKHKYLLIDGNGMLVSSFYASAPNEIYREKDPEALQNIYDSLMQNEKGESINGLVSMVKKVLNLIEYQKPTHLFIGFDRDRNTFRREMYPDYKAQRKESPTPLKQQVKMGEQLFIDMGIMAFSQQGVEADDLIGSMRNKIEREDPNAEIILITKDRDYLQLIDDHTTLWLTQQTWDRADELMTQLYPNEEERPTDVPKGSVKMNRENCKAIFGVYPEQIADWKGIAGDPSDNIPGVKGVSSAAIPLLAEYGTVENIYAAIDLAGDNKTAQNELKNHWKKDLGILRSPFNQLIVGREMGLLSKKLATIETGIKIDGSLEVYHKDNLDPVHIEAILDSYGLTPFMIDEPQETIENRDMEPELE